MHGIRGWRAVSFLLLLIAAPGRAQLDRFVQVTNVSTEAGAQFGSAFAAGDFNGDGLGDVAIGIPLSAFLDRAEAGRVSIRYSAPGEMLDTSQLLSEETFFDLAAVAGGEHFGAALVAGHFNDDRFADLAIGLPFEDVGSQANAGAVIVVYGDPAGFHEASVTLVLNQNMGLLDTAEANDRFGAQLAAGDFDGNGFDDLAIGVPQEDLDAFGGGLVPNVGMVQIVYSTASGLSTAGNQAWTQDILGLTNGVDQIENNDQFGLALAAGNFDGDGFDDLAVGARQEDLPLGGGGNGFDAGAVNVIYGAASGLASARTQFWHQDVAGVNDAVETLDLFGWTLVTGNFNGVGPDDLAIGVPGESVSGAAFAGAVNVLYGTTGTGLTSSSDQLINQGFVGGPTIAAGNAFGQALAAGDFDGDGGDDLAIGAPDANAGAINSVGVVEVAYSFRGFGLVGFTGQWFEQGMELFDTAETDDRAGWSLATAKLADGGTDLVIGVPFEDFDGTSVDSGMFHVVSSIVVFADSFESTDTNAWSATVP